MTDFDSLSPHERAAILSHADSLFTDEHNRIPTKDELNTLCSQLAVDPKRVRAAVRFLDGPGWVNSALKLGEKRERGILR